MDVKQPLIGIRVYNGVTRDINLGGPPIFMHGSLKPGKSDFSTLFAPIIESDALWAFRNSADMWRVPFEWFDEFDGDEPPQGSRLFEIFNSGYLSRDPADGLDPRDYVVDGKSIRNYNHSGVFEAKFMQKYGVYVRNEWNEIVTLASGLKDFLPALKYFSENCEHSVDRDRNFIKKNVSRYFYNFDGLFWWFFTREEDELTVLKEYLASLKTVRVVDEPTFDIRKIKMEYWEK